MGERVELEAPWSEVCMHLRVAGRRVLVERRPGNMAQLYTLDGEPISFPITAGEAGLTADRCQTIGCTRYATGQVTYPGVTVEVITDRVCTECGQGYARRPALKATWTPDEGGRGGDD